MTSLLPRLGPLRWLAHKVLGWEYVWLLCDHPSGEPRCIVRARRQRLPHETWHVAIPDAHIDRLEPDGTLYLFPELVKEYARHGSKLWSIRWHPLTPGVAGFYGGAK